MGCVVSAGLADLDGDGDQDVVVASRWDDKVSWYRNIDGKGTFGQQDVISTDAVGTMEVRAADVDGDGDLDILSAFCSFDELTSGVAWHENTDGDGSFAAPRVIAVGSPSWVGHHPEQWWTWVRAEDVDGDDDIDILSASESTRVTWHENLTIRASASDANRDLEFDEHDIVLVLQAVKYLTGESATWEEGDWNGDGVFDPEDIVAALQTGTYLQGPYVDATVAEQTEG